MKRLFILTLFLGLSFLSMAQSPELFNYQAVIRDASGQVVPNKSVSIRLSIHEKFSIGLMVYQEEHFVKTNDYGIVNLHIGGGTNKVGTLGNVGWGNDVHVLNIAVDRSGGTNYVVMGYSQLVSVPYALYAANVNNNDTSATNELQMLSLNNDTLYLSNGNSVYLPAKDYSKDIKNLQDSIVVINSKLISIEQQVKNDSIYLSSLIKNHITSDLDIDTTNEIQNLSLAGNTLTISKGNSIVLPTGGGPNNDNDSTNELITTVAFTGTTLSITDAGGTKSVNLGSLLDNTDAQFLSISGNVLSIGNGNSVTLPTGAPNNDNDSTNELNVSVNFSGTTLTITDAGGAKTANLSSLMDNTDNQTLTLTGNVLSIAGGNSVTLPASTVNLDNDSTNEIQQQSLTGTNLNLSRGGGTVSLASFMDNTDGQTLTISGSTLSITGGNSVTLPAGVGPNNDNDSTNEIQTITLNTNNLMLSNGGGTVSLASYLDNTDAQAISFNGDTLYLSNGGWVYLGAYTNTDAQALSLAGNVLSISGGNSITLPASTVNLDNDSTNEIQSLSLSGNTLTISKGNTVTLPSSLPNLDNDSTNEIQALSLSSDTLFISQSNYVVLPSGTINTDDQNLSLSGDTLYIEDGTPVVLTKYLNTDSQALSLLGSTLSITGGNSVTLPAGGAPNYDNDSTNELQNLSLVSDTVFISNGNYIVLPTGTINTDDQNLNISGDTLYIEDGNAVLLSKYLDNTDGQTLSLSGNTLSISGGNSVTLASGAVNHDNDSTNELNTAFALSGNNLILTDAGGAKTVNLAPFLDNTDAQAISISGDTIYLSNGGFVKLPAATSGYDGDSSSTNELQAISISNDTIYLTSGGFIKLPAATSGYDGDSSSTNELQNLALMSDTLRISGGNYVVLPTGTVNTDDQNLILSNDTLRIEDGNYVVLPAAAANLDNDSTNELIGSFIIVNDSIKITDAGGTRAVNLSSYLDNTDAQMLSLSGDTIYLSNGGFIKLPAATSGYDGDSSSTNELQNLALMSDTLRISGGNYVVLPTGTVNTDDQNLILSNDTLRIEDGNYVVLPAAAANLDNDSTNELQAISISNDTIYLSDGGFVKLPAATTGFDGDSSSTNELQALSMNNDTLYLTNGGKVYLGNYTNTDNQNLILAGNNLSISGGNSVALPLAPANNDNDSTNELQNLSISGNTISISNGNSINLPAGTVNNDNDSTNEYNTSVGLSGNILSVTDGGGAKTADLSALNQSGEAATVDAKRQADSTQFAGAINGLNGVAFLDTSASNEIQSLSLSGSTLSISGGNSVTLPNAPANNDNDSTNEIQDLQLVGTSLSITNNSSATVINLAPFTGNNTDSQKLSISNDTIFLTNGGSVKLPADNVNDGDTSSINEIQNLSLSGNALSISGGNTIVLPSAAASLDNDSTNEYNTSFTLSGNNLSIADGGGSKSVDLSSFKDNTDSQSLSVSGSNLSISGGNTVALPSVPVNNDNDSTNELVTSFGLIGNSLSLTDAGGTKTVSLASYLDNTDAQMISISGDTIFLSNGGSIKLPAATSGYDGDSSSTNELITYFAINSNNLTISDAGGGKSVSLAPYLDNTDSQSLSLSGTTLSISGGNSVTLPSGAANNDNDSTNELNTSVAFSGTTLTITDAGGAKTADLSALKDNTDSQSLSLAGNILSISGGNNVTLPSGTASNDNDSTNEIQTISLSGNTLSLNKGGGSTNLSSYLDNTDAQTLSLSGSVLSISGGNNVTLPSGAANNDNDSTNELNSSVGFSGTTLTITDAGGAKTADLSSLKDNTDSQTLSLSGNTLSISGGNNVTLPASAANNDNDSTNELNTAFAISSNNLTITDAGGAKSVSLAPYLDNTDAQTLSLSGNTLTISGGNNVTLPSGSTYTTKGIDSVLTAGNNAAGLNLTNLGSLSVNNGVTASTIRMTTGAGANKIMTSDASGNATWQTAATVAAPSEIKDADNDTKIQVEESADEDIIRFDLAGTEQFTMTKGRFEPQNTGRSSFYGYQAGLGDDYTNNENSAFGYQSLKNITTGVRNTSMGTYSMDQTSGVNSDNVALGAYSLRSANGANYNTAVGSQAMEFVTSGDYNSGVGYRALENINGGAYNSAVGGYAGTSISSGSYNAAIGYEALRTNTNGAGNVAFGYRALRSNSSTSYNVAIGYDALYNSNAAGNIAIGFYAMRANTSGTYNVAMGYRAMNSNVNGSRNVSLGFYSMYDMLTGSYNVSIGDYALANNINGSNNVVLGRNAGYNNVTGSTNVFLGYQAGFNELGSDVLYIENSNSSTPLIYGDFSNDSLRVNGSLTVSGNVVIPTGAGAGKVLASDANGKATWQVPGAVSLGDTTQVSDLDGDTKIQTEESSDEDIIRFDIAGTERWVMTGARLETYNTGYSVFIGEDAGMNDDLSNNGNNFIGYQAGRANSTGSNNVGMGYYALRTNSTGANNTALGSYSLYLNQTGSSNSALGYGALRSNVTGDYNSALGLYSLYGNSTGSYNASTGYYSLAANTTGSNNSAFGALSLRLNTTGYDNTALGDRAGYNNSTGYRNIYIGRWAGYFNTTGYHNVSLGYSALYRTSSGYENVGIGYLAGDYNQVGLRNTYVGSGTGPSSAANYNNSTALGYGAIISASNQIRIGDNAVTSIGGYQGWTNVSDARFKKDVNENVIGLDFVMALRPVTYHLDMNAIAEFNGISDSSRNMEAEIEKGKMLQSGFIAQEVEAVAKLLGYDFSGIDAPKNPNDNYGLRYSEFVVPLVKGMQEQQHIIEKQQQKIDHQEMLINDLLKRIEALEVK